ncbi:hypothetical protein GCM10009827_004900 [Dactylosporangium maewongense]|uniref:Uncharacterized protein n=1 Tax=Dactylosporangium maewongense TaxID=634393 RepID=A0ABN1ZJK2_9ACTN
MPDQTDPTRELIRRAYADLSYSGDNDFDGDLADVVQRAGRPRVQDDTADVITLAPRRSRRRFAAVATFAAAVVTILGVYAASAGVRPGQSVGAPTPNGSLTATPGATEEPGGTPTPASATPPVSVPSVPQVLPSSCASSWVMELAGTTFKVTEARGSCPALSLDRIWLLDARSGNGRVAPGDAVLWTIVPVDGGKGSVQPPFTFRPRGWPGPVAGHTYEVIYVSQDLAPQLKPGDDAAAAYETALSISRTVIA